MVSIKIAYNKKAWKVSLVLRLFMQQLCYWWLSVFMIIYYKLFWTHSTKHSIMLAIFLRTSFPKIPIQFLNWERLKNTGMFKKEIKNESLGIYNELRLTILKWRMTKERNSWVLWLIFQIILFISVQIRPVIFGIVHMAQRKGAYLSYNLSRAKGLSQLWPWIRLRV